MQPSLDSLDQQRQLYQQRQNRQRSQSSNNQGSPNAAYKNFYRQQLDDLVRQKQEQKKIQSEREARQRFAYNQRIVEGVQMEKMKDLSYRNYYQMLLKNQEEVSKAFVPPFYERDHEKQKLISNGIEVDKKRSQVWQEQEQRRNQQMRKNYRELLTDQINQKYNKNAVQKQVRQRQQNDYTKMTYTPLQVARFERERKVQQMQKYKQDLDKSSPNLSSSRDKSFTNPGVKNDFNVSQVQDRHNPLVNPLPYNIQNPYILKQMMRKQPTPF